jgi:CheY-like chemotaxis protein
MRILLVEDHPFVAQISCSVLREIHEHQVDHAATAAAAIELASKNSFDVILIDLNLPDMNGYKLAAKLRTDPRMNDTIFIALTGIGNFIDPDAADDSGIDAYYAKPMDFKLLDQIQRAGRKQKSAK